MNTDNKISISLSFLLLVAFFSRETLSSSLQVEQTSSHSTTSSNSSIASNDQCSEYQIGEERHLSGLFANYSVKRESDKHYKASVALRFIITGNYYDKNNKGMGIVDFEHYTHTQQIQRARDCIRSVNSKMLGPHGETLEITIKDGYEEKDTVIDVHTIIISDIEIVFNSYRQYAPNIDCSTMTHEILHLFNLNDEHYGEWSIQLILHPVTSNVQQISFVPLHNNCNNTKMCSGQGLPLQYYSIMSYGIKRWGDVFNSSEISLLDPTHFNAIIYGNCRNRSDVKLYRDCYGSANSGPILSIEECQKQDVLGRGKRRELQIINNEFSIDNGLHLFLEHFKEYLKIPLVIDEQVYDQYMESLRERRKIVQNWPDQ